MKSKPKNNMVKDANNIEKANELVGKLSPKSNVKYIKKDKGLIERNTIKDDKVILTEDNRQILFG